ncbi:hypothetical protein P8452_01836 [Trifolium repens]|nr:hypothetical protein P8452_01836 [Trifolium repens]
MLLLMLFSGIRNAFRKDELGLEIMHVGTKEVLWCFAVEVGAEFVVVRCVIAGDESSGFLVFGFGVFRRSFNKNYFSWPWLLSWHARKGEDSWSR